MRLFADAFSRRTAATLFAALLAPPPPRPAHAALYCVPGVTAERCRGVFWETGKLYKKEMNDASLTTDEYLGLLARLRTLRSTLGSKSLGDMADLGSSSEVGSFHGVAPWPRHSPSE